MNCRLCRTIFRLFIFMKNIRENIRETVRQLIAEAMDEARKSGHVDQRYRDRIEPIAVPVGIRTGTDDFTAVGMYQMSQATKDFIKDRIRELELIDFPMGLHMGVKITEFHLNDRNVRFDSPDSMETAKGKSLYLIGPGSKGDEVWITVNDNTLTSLMFRIRGAGGNRDWEYAAKNIADAKAYIEKRKKP